MVKSLAVNSDGILHAFTISSVETQSLYFLNLNLKIMYPARKKTMLLTTWLLLLVSFSSASSNSKILQFNKFSFYRLLGFLFFFFLALKVVQLTVFVARQNSIFFLSVYITASNMFGLIIHRQ